jgi:hypothetical protein
VKHPRIQRDDPLLWRLRRSVIQAGALRPQDHRKALALTAEIGTQLAQLKQRLKSVESEIRAVSYRMTAVSAYQRCAALGHRTRK